MLRSGTVPSILRSDRGPEFKNALMNEYTSLIGLGHRFGTPWRPMEQGIVEGSHKETQKIMGMLVKDIMQCFPNETAELQYVLEFVVYNTPGPHGYTPRDLDRRWSLALPLEKELQPFQVNEFEPVSEFAKKLFHNYRQIRVRVMGYLQKMSSDRAELANRWRRSKKLEPGMQVVLRDPRQRKAGGRTPYRQPHTDPCTILEVRGNKCKVRKADGTILPDVHLEDALLVPDNLQSLEKKPLEFEEEELTVEDRRSPGMMLEDDGKQVEAHNKTFNKTGMKPGKLAQIHSGNIIAYKVAGKVKVVTVGKIQSTSLPDGTAVVHRYRPVTDNRLRLYWTPIYISEEGGETLGSGATASTETVPVNRILYLVQLHDGVLSHADARSGAVSSTLQL